MDDPENRGSLGSDELLSLRHSVKPIINSQVLESAEHEHLIQMDGVYLCKPSACSSTSRNSIFR